MSAIRRYLSNAQCVNKLKWSSKHRRSKAITCVLVVYLEVCTSSGSAQLSVMGRMKCHLYPILCTWDAVTTCIPVTGFFPLEVSVLPRPVVHLVCLVHHLVSSRKPFCTTWFESNYDIHSATRLISTSPKQYTRTT